MAYKARKSYEQCSKWNTKGTVNVRRFNYDTRETETVAEVSTYDLRHSMDVDTFTNLLDGMLNGGCLNGFRGGAEVGENLRTTHRTLQGLAVEFAFGILAGISDQEYTDPRNETAIAMAKKVTTMREDGTLDYQMYI